MKDQISYNVRLLYATTDAVLLTFKVEVSLLGFRSWSSIDLDESMITKRCRIWFGANYMHDYNESLTTKNNDITMEDSILPSQAELVHDSQTLCNVTERLQVNINAICNQLKLIFKFCIWVLYLFLFAWKRMSSTVALRDPDSSSFSTSLRETRQLFITAYVFSCALINISGWQSCDAPYKHTSHSCILSHIVSEPFCFIQLLTV